MTSSKGRSPTSRMPGQAKASERQVLVAAVSLLGVSLGAVFETPAEAAIRQETTDFSGGPAFSSEQRPLAVSQNSAKEPSLTPSQDSAKEHAPSAGSEDPLKARSPATPSQESIRKPSAPSQDTAKERSPTSNQDR
jgi:hypothetical protein